MKVTDEMGFEEWNASKSDEWFDDHSPEDIARDAWNTALKSVAPLLVPDGRRLVETLRHANDLLRQAIGWNWLDDDAPRPDTMDVLDQEIEKHLTMCSSMLAASPSPTNNEGE